MFATKKKKIRTYLAQKSENEYCAFDHLLTDYVNGTLKTDLTSVGMRRIEIHIDWLEDIKCIAIQAQYEEYLTDIQIYPNEFSVAFDTDEPDSDTVYPFESKKQFYDVLIAIAHTLA